MRPNAKGAEVALARYGIVPERIELLTTGHINETWYVADAANEWLLQWLNHGVFPQARAVQANMEVVLAHLAGKDARRSLTPALRPAADGARAKKGVQAAARRRRAREGEGGSQAGEGGVVE